MQNYHSDKFKLDLAKALGFLVGSPAGIFFTNLFFNFGREEYDKLMLVKIIVSIFLFVISYWIFLDAYAIACRMDIEQSLQKGAKGD